MRKSTLGPLIDALARGIGVHHSGLPKKYRELVEKMFRMRHLRVIIATGTLALGINMPCRTVVFAGDSGIYSIYFYSLASFSVLTATSHFSIMYISDLSLFRA